MVNEEWMVESILYLLEHQGGGSGTTDYSKLSNKPKIDSIELVGDKTHTELGIASASDLEKKVDLVDDSLPVKVGRDTTGLFIEN